MIPLYMATPLEHSLKYIFGEDTPIQERSGTNARLTKTRILLHHSIQMIKNSLFLRIKEDSFLEHRLQGIGAPLADDEAATTCFYSCINEVGLVGDGSSSDSGDNFVMTCEGLIEGWVGIFFLDDLHVFRERKSWILGS